MNVLSISRQFNHFRGPAGFSIFIFFVSMQEREIEKKKGEKTKQVHNRTNPNMIHFFLLLLPSITFFFMFFTATKEKVKNDRAILFSFHSFFFRPLFTPSFFWWNHPSVQSRYITYYMYSSKHAVIYPFIHSHRQFPN